MKKTIYLLLISSALIGFGCGSKDTTTETGEGIDVTLAQVRETLAPEPITFSGRFFSHHSVDLSTKLTGTISYLAVEEGQPVAEGQLLAKINSADIQAKKLQAVANLSEAKAQLATVQKDHSRIESLYRTGSATEKEWDDIQYALTAAKAKLASIENTVLELDELLNYSEIRAPLEGFVTKKHRSEGDLATPGIPIVTLESSQQLKVVTKIPESELSYIHIGDTLEVKSETAGADLKAIVSHINPSSLSGNLQFEATLRLIAKENPGLKSGMYAQVKGFGNLQKKVMVPQEAIFRQGQLTGVFTINSQNKTSVRWIRVGKTTGNKVEVLSGLSEGEQIIVKSPARLQSGLIVNVAN